MTVSLLPPDLLSAAERALQACSAAGLTIALAESCTGGLIAAALTSIPGSSAVLEGGFVTYSNIAKETMLGVAPSLIRTHGAVSEEVASAMVRGVLEETSAGVAVAVTGIAGPGGATDTKPVGLVHLVAMTADGRRLHAAPVFPGDRQAVRAAAATMALEMISTLATG